MRWRKAEEIALGLGEYIPGKTIISQNANLEKNPKI